MENLTDVDAYTSPVEVPEDGVDLDTAASIEGAFQALADRTRHLKGLVGGVAGSSEWVYADGVRSRSRVIGPAGIHSQWDSGGGNPAWGIGDAASRVVLTLLTPTNAGFAYAPMSSVVPHGSTITQIHARVKPAAAELTGDRVELAYFFEDHTISAAHAGPTGTVEDDGTTDEQTLSITGLSLPVNTNGTYSMRIRGGDTLGSALWWVRINYDQPGPR
jgi:hypothetical protein